MKWRFQMLRPNRFAMAFLAIGSFAANAQAGISLDLFRQVPAPPADEATALRWWKDGKLGGPEIQPFLDQLEKDLVTVKYPEADGSFFQKLVDFLTSFF